MQRSADQPIPEIPADGRCVTCGAELPVGEAVICSLCGMPHGRE